MMAVLALLMTGCIRASVPVNAIKADLSKGTVAISNPKNMKLTGVHIKADKNGTASVDIDSAESIMDPAIITTTADGQVKMFNAVGDNVLKAVQAATAAKP